jgi:hypothetical protein
MEIQHFELRCLSNTYLTIRTGDLGEDAHDRADQVKESHGEKKEQTATTRRSRVICEMLTK